MTKCNRCGGKGYGEAQQMRDQSGSATLIYQCCNIGLYAEEVRRRYAKSWDGGRVLYPPVGTTIAMRRLREGSGSGQGGEAGEEGRVSEYDFSGADFPIWAILERGAVELAGVGVGTGRQILR